MWNTLNEMRWSDKNWPDSFTSLWLIVSSNNSYCFLLTNFLNLHKSLPVYKYLTICHIIVIFYVRFFLLKPDFYQFFILWYYCIIGSWQYSVFRIMYEMLERKLYFHRFSRSAAGCWIIFHFHKLPYYLNSKPYIQALLYSQKTNCIIFEDRHNSVPLEPDEVW